LSTEEDLAAEDLGATAENAEALAVKVTSSRVAEKNFMVVILWFGSCGLYCILMAHKLKVKEIADSTLMIGFVRPIPFTA
jgi:hypothetical protein